MPMQPHSAALLLAAAPFRQQQVEEDKSTSIPDMPYPGQP